MKKFVFTLGCLSLLIFLCTCGLWVRSYFKFDAVSRSNWTAQPLTAQALAYAQQRGFSAQVVSRGESFSAQTWRGRITFVHGGAIRRDEPMG